MNTLKRLLKYKLLIKKTRVYIICIDLNRRVNFFILIYTQLLPLNFGVTLVEGFHSFTDENGLLSHHLSRRLTKFLKPDYLHLNWKGVVKLGAIIKNTILLIVNCGRDGRRTGRRGIRWTPHHVVT